jgi:DNA-binding XRE family transcriptional regulator
MSYRQEFRVSGPSFVEAVSLNRLRDLRKLTQANLGGILGINQGSVSKMEKRTDMYASTLRSFVEGMGGQLQIKAVFPKGEVLIEQFASLDDSSGGSKRGTAA